MARAKMLPTRSARSTRSTRFTGRFTRRFAGARLLLALLPLLVLASCRGGTEGTAGATERISAASVAPSVGAEAVHARGLAVASSNGVGGGVEDEDLASQAPESYALRGRAPGEGHADEEADAELGEPSGEIVAELEVGGEPSGEPGAERNAGDEEEEDEDEKDYWREVEFTLENFEEVRQFVKRHYIDDHIDVKRAYIEASNFALLALEEQPLEILPETFYELRQGHPDEDGRLAGRVYKLRPTDAYVVHEVPKDLESPYRNRRLDDYELRQLRLRDKARHALIERHWERVPFGERDFRALLDEARGNGAKRGGDFRMADLMIAAAQGYLFSLDPHSSLVSARAWEESTQQTEDSSFDGIGAVLTQRDNRTIVESPIEGQPAVRAGLRAGDVIMKVDKRDIGGVPLFKVVKRIRGPRGTKVTLTIRRMGQPEDLEITITRARIAIRNVSGRLLGDPYPDVAYIKMTGFVPSSAERFDAMIEELTAQTASGRLRGLVFDLRNDNGGLLSQGIEVANRFLPEGAIVVSVRNKASMVGGGGERHDEVYRATALQTITCPVIVLVNDGTASAAEIVASAIQENRRGLIIGDRTFGKASVQTLYPPPGRRDYFIKLTVARYFSPTGRTIQLTGVMPDILVPPEVGGDMPLGFREENLRNPLPPRLSYYRSPFAELLGGYDSCVREHGQAESLHAADPNPAIKFDYQLMKGADYLECVLRVGASAGTARQN